MSAPSFRAFVRRAFAVSVILVSLGSNCRKASAAEGNAADKAYLFTSFRGNGEEGLRFLYSRDGYHWTNVPGTFLKPGVGPSKLMRDPSLVRGPDGTFHLVWTTGWHGDQGFGYAKSKDLAHWSGQKFVPIMEHEPGTVNVWAPELFYDDKERQFIVCWASTIPGRFPDQLEDHTNNHRLYFTTTRDFETFSPAKLFYDPGFSVIDGFVVKEGAQYVLVHKDNSRPNRNLRVAWGSSPMGPWGAASEPFTGEFTEGPCVLRVGENWIIYYDAYRSGIYGAVRTRDFKSFADITKEVVFPQGHKHGTAIEVSEKELDGLLKASGGSGAVTKAKGKKKPVLTPEEEEAAYTHSIEGRTADILGVLVLTEVVKISKVHDLIIAQYRGLKAWHDANDARLKQLNKEARGTAESQAEQEIKTIQVSLKKLHDQYISELSKVLTDPQVEQVKDKMTYNKVKVTYDAYDEIVPGLTTAEKARMLELLKEAREEAMDGGSADEKSAVFKKYKGKINNYLSQQGHDVSKAYKDWGQKQKARGASQTSPLQ